MLFYVKDTRECCKKKIRYLSVIPFCVRVLSFWILHGCGLTEPTDLRPPLGIIILISKPNVDPQLWP